MFDKNTRAMVCQPDGDSDFFDIIDGVLQRDIFSPYTLKIERQFA